MKNDVVEIGIRGVMPTPNGCALFLGSDAKTFVIYVEASIGHAISMIVNEVRKERPLTHDLIGHMFGGFGVSLERIIINDVDNGTFYARIILKMENELGTKITEVDSRPSDAIVLALQAGKPMYANRLVMDSVDDVTEVLKKLMNQEGGEEPPEF
tara:strand:+ start:15300 stop:15764 length:465 start_codon:yes stop_codon:yes gene_type:complete